jgi:two-component system, OmpR family, response regulator RegX3
MVETQCKVLIVEDESSFVEALKSGLKNEGFQLDVATTGEEALGLIDASPPDMVLLDLMLPNISGIDVCREIRRRSSVPIVMLTARNSEIDIVVGLEVGADDYITKPFRLRELVARMRSVLRRSAMTNDSSGSPSGLLEVGPIHFDATRHEVRVDGIIVAMPLKEFELLGYLLANAGQVTSRDFLIRKVWGEDYVGDTKTLDVHIKRLRAKIEPVPSQPVWITTVRGLGYKMETSRESVPV